MALITTGIVYERAGATLLARIEGHDFAALVQSQISAIAYEVWNLSTNPPTKTIAETALAEGDVWHDSLQTGAEWTIDATGYNFSAALPAATFPDSKLYRVELQITPDSGAVIRHVWELDAAKIYFGD